ncbi:hypothetical protein JCM12178A_12950 [Salidesulfovibrio brasiliensis]
MLFQVLLIASKHVILFFNTTFKDKPDKPVDIICLLNTAPHRRQASETNNSDNSRQNENYGETKSQLDP